MGEEVLGSGDGFGGFGGEVDGSRGEDVAIEAGLADVPVDAAGGVGAGTDGRYKNR